MDEFVASNGGDEEGHNLDVAEDFHDNFGDVGDGVAGAQPGINYYQVLWRGQQCEGHPVYVGEFRSHEEPSRT